MKVNREYRQETKRGFKEANHTSIRMDFVFCYLGKGR